MDNDMSVVTANGLVPISNGGMITAAGAWSGNISTVSTVGSSNIKIPKSVDEILDEFELNEVVVEHKVTEHELMKLKETVDYNEIIKHNLAKMLSQRVLEKARFTKKKDLDHDETSFRARVWVFNKEELLDLIKEIKNV